MNAIKKFIIGFGRFWYDFIIGDDWKIAVAVVIGLAATAGLMVYAFSAGLSLTPFTVIGAVIVLVLFVLALVIDLRPKRG